MVAFLVKRKIQFLYFIKPRERIDVQTTEYHLLYNTHSKIGNHQQ